MISSDISCEDSRPGRGLLVVAIYATVIGLVAANCIPFTVPIPVNLELARHLALGEKIPNSFLPVGYTAFLAACLRIAGQRGIYLGQIACYVLGVLGAYGFLRVCGLRTRGAQIGAAVIALHPYLLANIKRGIDNAVAVPLLLLMCLGFAFLVTRTGRRLFIAAFVGIILGLLVSIRPNAILLIFVALYLADRGPGVHRVPFMQRSPVLLILVCLTIAPIVILTHTLVAEPSILPYNGSYNLFAGANPLSRQYLISRYNAEQSIPDALAMAGIPGYDSDSLGQTQTKAFEPVFRKLANEFIVSHPAEFAGLTVLKAATLFRPDFRQTVHAGLLHRFILYVSQTLLALVAPLWLVCRLWARHRNWATRSIIPISMIAVLYLLPFVLTNSDPRFRLPLDLVLLLDAVRCIGQHLSRQLLRTCNETAAIAVG